MNHRENCYPVFNRREFLLFLVIWTKIDWGLSHLLYPPQTKLGGGVYSDRSFVRPSVRPSQSLIRHSTKTAEQNFMKLSGIVHYMMPYCTSYFKILFQWFSGFPEQNKDFATQHMGERGYNFMSIAYSISSFKNIKLVVKKTTFF